MGVPIEFHFLLFHVLLLLPSVVLSLDPPFACDSSNPSTKNYTFCDTALPIGQRVTDLISRLTLEEKIAQLVNNASSIPRLGMPAYEWWSEGLHGVSNWGPGIFFNGTIRSATSFPQVILTAASFDPQIWYQIGQAVGTETRAIYNTGQAAGLTLWSPNVNIFRDPRWGRGQETPGEDPTIASKYAVYFVRGLQGDSFEGGSSAPLKTSACCKHFTAYDVDNWNGTSRYSFNAQVSAQDLEDTYQPPFKSCVQEGRASCIMCSYNSVNGVPTCADYNLLSDTAKVSWGIYGYVASDCNAIDLIYLNDLHYAKTPEDAVAATLNAGLDVECGSYVARHALSAVQQGKLFEWNINRALHNLFTTRMRLGLFNGNPKDQPYGNIALDQVCTTEHWNLALDAARDGIVLLKNSDGALPLSRSKVTSLGLIGPNGNNDWILIGNYGGPPCNPINPFKALQSYVNDTRYFSGCDTAACNSSSIDEAVQFASSVDYVVLFMGLDQDLEKEGLDRENLTLPGMQQSLVESVANAAKRPVILVLLCGGPIDVTFAINDNKIGGILWAGYPGEAGGLAIAQVLFGEHNPGGRLPVTWYPQSFTSVPMTDMRMRADPNSGYPGRTYRFYTGEHLFYFGYGLSYSNYSYEFSAESESTIYINKSISLDASMMANTLSYDITNVDSEACEKLKFSTVIGVQNHGPMDGKHPVLLFLRWPDALNGKPMKQLIGFQSQHLKAGERADVKYVVSPCEHLSRTSIDGKKLLDLGSHFLVTGEKEYQITVVA